MKTSSHSTLSVAINHTLAAELAIGTAANIAPIEGTADWQMISPYGEFPNSEGRQRVTQKRAQQMVALFNSQLAKLGRLFRGVPIYVGHPDADPQRWPDQRRLGRVDALQARAEGLFGKLTWNKLGRENIEEGYYAFPSPAWHFEKVEPGIIEPVDLVSIGLTNTPNIHAVRPWTNSDGNDQGKMTNDQASCELSSPQARRIAFGARLDELTLPLARGGNGFTVDAAIKHMRATPADAALLAAMDAPAWTNSQSNGQRTMTNDRYSSAEARRIAFNARLDELMLPLARGGKGLTLEAAIKRMRGTPADAALIAAMQS